MARIDKLGRLGIPQNLRERYGINGDVTEVSVTDTGNGILIKPLENKYTIDDSQMKVLRELYIMLDNSGLLDSYIDEVLSKMLRKSESKCAKCDANLYLNADNTLKCYNCKGE